ncbi:S-adenosyl-L-methionine-dependent methyltransferase [Mariannaea sp. PMI_226]|nr:S-adenosyl-L-methionine-dependent methyltransferase [Mariannaea sp. PMI_226]
MASPMPSGGVVGPSPAVEAVPVESVAALAIKEVETQTGAQLPPHRSHDPTNNLKRSDPFQFGSRFLLEGDDVYEFNAWDHVETNDEYKEHAERQYAKQREHPVSDFEKRRFNTDPAKWWDLFYKNNQANFFKNRKWLQQEFPILTEVTKEDAGPKVVLEIGAGAGNTAFPILANNKNPQLKVHACDYSKIAVDVMRKHEEYDPKYIQADVWDASSDSLPPDLEEGSVDVAILIFIFSALSPGQWAQAVRNVHRVLKPGGMVCFRDYGRGDLAQVRFRKNRYLEENFYLRGDGTRVYFFDQDELADIWRGKKTTTNTSTSEEKTVESQDVDGSEESIADVSELFEIQNLGVDRRMLVNRAEKIKMYRCWLQGRFRKR